MKMRMGCAALAVLVLHMGCGGGSPAIPRQSSVTVAILGSSRPGDPAVMIRSKAGDTISYFAASGSRTPSQALLTTAAGDAVRVHYAADGSLQKIVDEKSGAFVIIKTRADGGGANYLAYDAKGAFRSGYALYRIAAGKWYTANVLGSLGQLAGHLTGGLNASFALKPAELSYGPATEVPANLAAVFNHTAKLSSRSPLLSIVVPAAWAQTVTVRDRAMFNSGLALAVIGGFVLRLPSPDPITKIVGIALLGAGALQVWRGTTGILERNPDALDAAVTGGMENTAEADVDAGMNLVQSLQSMIQNVADRGMAAINTVAGTLNRVAGALTGVAMPAEQADETPAPSALPTAMGVDTSLAGTIVDTANTVYPASGTIDASGAYAVTGTASNGNTVSVDGTADATNMSLSGTYSERNQSGSVVASGNVSGGKIASLGQCASTTQSGGFGTFSYAFDLGRDSGTFDLSYDMYSIPDAMTIVLGSQVLFSTGGLVSGGKSLSLQYSGGDTVFVNVSAPDQGTAWTFTIGCGH